MDNLENTPKPFENNPKGRNNIVIGLILVVIGLAALVKNVDMGIHFPQWLFTWPVILIIIGIITGLRHRFRGFAWLALILIGLYFLAVENNLFSVNLRPYTIPVVLILLGIMFMIKKHHNNCDTRSHRRRSFNTGGGFGNTWMNNPTNAGNASDDFFEINSIFASNERRILAKNLKGGKVSCTFGGAEIDMTHADIDGEAVIDVFAAFGGMELAVPANWVVKNEISVILGGIDDKRRMYQPSEPVKTLILKGNVICGGVEIRS